MLDQYYSLDFPHYCCERVLWLKYDEIKAHAMDECPRYECPLCKVSLVGGNRMTGNSLRDHLRNDCTKY